MVPPVLALAADVHLVLSPESYPMACSPYPDFPGGGLGFSLYVGGRWYLLGCWAVPIALFLAVLQLWRVLSAFVVSSLVAFAACGVLESPVGGPVRRWVVAALQPDCPEEPRGSQADSVQVGTPSAPRTTRA